MAARSHSGLRGQAGQEGVLNDSLRSEADADARGKIDRAIEFMQKQPFPKPESALEDVFA